MEVRVVGTEHFGGGNTLDYLNSIEFNYDLYCLEIDLYRLESLTWFDEEDHLDCDLVYYPSNKQDWLDLGLGHISSETPIDTLNRFSSKTSDALLNGCDIPDGDGPQGADIRFVLNNLQKEDRVALVDSGFVNILEKIDNSGLIKNLTERIKANWFVMKAIQALNPYDDFDDCHRLMRNFKPYIQPYGDLLYDYREAEIASNIDAIASSNDDVLLVVGFNHLTGVSERLERRGFDVHCVDAVTSEEV